MIDEMEFVKSFAWRNLSGSLVDPLLLYIFVLRSGSQLIMDLVERGDWKPFQTCRGSFVISHLMFVGKYAFRLDRAITSDFTA